MWSLNPSGHRSPAAQAGRGGRQVEGISAASDDEREELKTGAEQVWGEVRCILHDGWGLTPQVPVPFVPLEVSARVRRATRERGQELTVAQWFFCI